MLTLMRPSDVAFLGKDILVSVKVVALMVSAAFVVIQTLLMPHMKQDNLRTAHSEQSCRVSVYLYAYNFSTCFLPFVIL